MADGKVTKGLAIVEYANIANDGTVGTSWYTLGLTDRDSEVSVVEDDPEVQNVLSHELSTPIDTDYNAGAKNVVFSLVNPTKEQRAKLVGGTITGSGDAAVLTIPSARTPIEVAVRFIPKKGDVHTFNRVKLWGKKNANFASDSKVLYDVTGQVLIPIKAGVVTEQEGPDVGTVRGAVATATTINGGAGYTNGTVTGVKLVAGSKAGGESCVATVVVASGAATTITITSGGKGYTKGTVLYAADGDLPGGTGFEAVVATVTP